MFTLPLFGTIIVAACAAFLVRIGRRQQLFSLVGFATIVVMFEYGAEAMKFLDISRFKLDQFSDPANLTIHYAPAAMGVAAAAYGIFYVAYAVTWLSLRPRSGAFSRRNRQTEEYYRDHWTAASRVILLALTALVIAVGFVQDIQRIRMAGGIIQFALTAYQHRVGTATPTAEQTAVVVAANVLGATAVGFMIFWTIAWLRRRLNVLEKFFVAAAWAILLFRQLTSMARSTFFFTVLALAAAVLSERPVRFKNLVGVLLMLALVLVGLNYVHMYMYFLTAEWGRQDIIESTGALVGAQGHLHTLTSILITSEQKERLHGEGLLASVAFFIPRVIWHSKPQSTAYGTYLIQSWADLPMEYQMAVTAPGELIAHFGFIGLIGMVVFGGVYAMLDLLQFGGPIGRSALFGLLIPRVLVDIGMGISAWSMSLLVALLFVMLLRGCTAFAELLTPSSAGRVMPRQSAPQVN